MGLNGIQSLFRHLQRQPGWEALRRYQVVQGVWEKVIDPLLLPQTRPLGIQRQVLTIAVSSPALAQNLQLQRVNLLKSLNEQLSQQSEEGLLDLRFSALHWHQRRSPVTTVQPLNDPATLPQPVVPPSPHQTPAKNVDEALTRWLHTLERRSPLLEECPQCHSPVSAAELKRWSSCGACARQQWQQPLGQSRPEAEKDGKTYGFPPPKPPR